MKGRAKLIELRNQRELFQKDVANAVGITTSYYGMIEQGVRTPNLDLAKRIAEFFGVSVEEIFFDAPNNILLSKRREEQPAALEPGFRKPKTA